MRLQELTEGLIKIPQPIHDAIMQFVVRRTFLYLKTKFRGKARQYPEQYRKFKSMAKAYNIDLKEKFDIRDSGLDIQLHTITKDELPYDMETTTDKIAFVIDWTGTAIRAGENSFAGWFPSKNAMMIYLHNFRPLQRIPYKKHSAEDLEFEINYIFSEVAASVEHEMQHMIQTIQLEPVAPEQTKRHPEYSTKKSHYYTSPVEFSPQIISSVYEFLNHLGTLRSMDVSYSYKKELNEFLAISKPKMFGSTSSFFKHLKNDVPIKYKDAVKKFMTSLHDRAQAESRDNFLGDFEGSKHRLNVT